MNYTSVLYTKSKINELRYIMTTPSGFDPSKESLPMIVFLHGAGERGDDLELVKVHGIPKYFCADNDYRGLRVITLSPQCPADRVWNHMPDQIMDLIEHVASDMNVDKKRITLTGISMGGYGTWEMACMYPDYFAAVAPICGGGMVWRAGALTKLPIRAFHGTDDFCVPYNASVEMVEAVKHLSGNVNVTLTSYDNVGHDSWTSAYETSDVIEWLAAAEK